MKIPVKVVTGDNQATGGLADAKMLSRYVSEILRVPDEGVASAGVLPISQAEYDKVMIGPLFAAGEQGVWYDPSDLSTMFQDSAGTTPVTAVEQPVGLLLDKSKGLVLGPELVTNGTFDANTVGWTLSTGTFVSSSGQAVLTSTTSTTTFAYQSFSTKVGATYVFEGRVVGFSGGAFRGIRKSDNNSASLNAVTFLSGAGLTKQYFTATATTTFIVVQLNGTSASDTITVDNISVREIAGNHASQSTSASRPTLSARYNLLTYSEQFNDAAWTKQAFGVAIAPTVTANAGIAPDGTNTADRVQLSLNGGSTTADFSQLTHSTDFQSGVSYTFSIWLKSNTGSPQVIAVLSFNTQLAFVTVTSEWSRFSYSITAGSTASSNSGIRIRGTQTAGTADVLAWGAQLIVTNDLASNAYQRIAAATDYDSDATKFPYYLRFDGTDDSLATSSIDFSGTNKLSIFSALRRLSDSAQGMVLELSATTASNNGTFSLETPSTASGSDFQFISKGTVANTINADDYPNPYSAIITAQSAISTPLSNIRINGLEVDSDAGTQGTGNFGNFPLYVGRRNNSSLPFNGRLYGMIVRGAETPEYLVEITESWLFGKSGITLDATPDYTFVTLSNGDFVVDAYGNNVFIEVS